MTGQETFEGEADWKSGNSKIRGGFVLLRGEVISSETCVCGGGIAMSTLCSCLQRPQSIGGLERTCRS